MKYQSFIFFDIVLTGALYTASFLSINILTSKWVNSAELTEIKQKLNNLKADEDIFLYQLTKQEKCIVDRNIGILIGNPQAENIITVVSNPHCNPCAVLHKELEKLLSKTNSYCIQYILTSFSEELELSSKLLIAMYQKLPKKEYLDFLNHWYATGKQNYQNYYKEYKFDTNDPILLNEFNLQKEWIKKTKLFYAPKTFFNGWEMPENYTINDLIYFQNIHTPH
ncbi:MAG: thioredoxin domain-containing protein [Tannerellaceae bacterium]|nr:thioredoxin domain-containing protein [Tannerellaceae bacterium]